MKAYMLEVGYIISENEHKESYDLMDERLNQLLELRKIDKEMYLEDYKQFVTMMANQFGETRMMCPSFQGCECHGKNIVFHVFPIERVEGISYDIKHDDVGAYIEVEEDIKDES